MATDRSLTTLLRALQSPSGEQVASRLLGSATTLLTLLSNPLNVALLTSQVLTAPAVWYGTDELQTSFRILGVFNAASLQKTQNDAASQPNGLLPAQDSLNIEDWVKAVVQGADDRSPRWKHMLVLSGLLLGFEDHYRRALPLALRRNLEAAVVRAANFALQDVNSVEDPSVSVICMALSYVLDILSDSEKRRIDHDRLLPLISEAVFFSRYGLHWGYFLGTMDADIVQDANNKFNWSAKAASYLQIQKMVSRPMVASLGGLARLMSLSVANIKDIQLLIKVSIDLAAFTRSLGIQWQRNKLSEVDATEEVLYFDETSMNMSLPLLWRVLKSALFAVIVVQSSLLGRVIDDSRIPVVEAPSLAIQNLHSLRNLNFISSRLGQNPFTQHTFVYLTCIDIISQFPAQAEAFLRDIRPSSSSQIPEHPQERCLDLYFLNTAENFAFFLPSTVSEELLIPAASTYLATGSDSRLLDIFEAAHSVMLAVFTCQQNQFIVIRFLPNYIEKLFMAFPQNLSSRQFRFAIRTLVRVTAPPSLISETQPLLSSTLMELVHSHIAGASPEPVPSSAEQAATNHQPLLSERATFVMTLIDSLPFLPIDALEEWLSITAESIIMVENHPMMHECKQRFWDVMSNGEMDVTRAQICVIWWNTKGGRNAVFHDPPIKDKELFMSVALGEASKL